MSSDWLVINIAFIFSNLCCQNYKGEAGIFRTIIVPTALLAGFIGLFIGPEVTGLINFDMALYEKIVFHSMALLRIDLAEKKTEHKSDTVKSGLFIVATYCFQGVRHVNCLGTGLYL